MLKFLVSSADISFQMFRAWVVSHATDLIIILLLVIIVACLFKGKGDKK